MQINIIGAGIFGATAAWSLAKRGLKVRLFEPGPIPNPEASTTDISKLIRMDYANDVFYTELMERAFVGWRKWNQLFQRPLFHEVGTLMLASKPMEAGSFEGDSFKTLSDRGHSLTRLEAPALAERFGQWNAEKYVDGYFNPVAGWAESAAVLQEIITFARQAGVEVHQGQKVAALLEKGTQVHGVKTDDGSEWRSDHVMVAVGAWTPYFFTELQNEMWPTAQAVFHFRPEDPAIFAPPNFVPWAADIARTGWYGFCANSEGLLKIANHGRGQRIDPRHDSRELAHGAEDAARAFFAESVPSAASAEYVGGRLCLYCDSFDGDFFIDHHPNRRGLFIASGGSGHAFKFAPMLGDIIADVLQKKENPFAPRFAWRARSDTKLEAARFSG